MAKKDQRVRHFFEEHWKVLLTLLGLIALGVGVTLGTVALDRYFDTGTASRGLDWGPALLLKVADHVGLGLFSVAILGIIIELPHMKEYFRKLIENTIISKAFIKQLNKSEQERLQERTLEAFFGVEELNQEGGFYKFYVNKIRSHIGGPFRKSTNFETVVELVPNRDSYKITDTIAYSCKKGAEGIQPKVVWTTEWDEIEDILQLDITATRPEQGAIADWYSFNKATNQCHRSLKPYPRGHGFTLPLDHYGSCDGLVIQVRVTYLVSRERPLSWSMPCLSDGFSGEIQFPSNLEIFVDLFGLSEDALPDKANLPQENGFWKYKIAHSDWLLPDDGFSFYFRPKKVSAALPAPAPPPAAPARPAPAQSNQ
ncbi:MAG TPA: hypothetical protein VGJ37_08260 [Pyrinomonadaceae bacterium]|jgi:hypothetical protein